MTVAKDGDSTTQNAADLRSIRSQYLHIKNIINDERDHITSLDSKKFTSLMEQFESIHKQVQSPREQVADADAFLDIASKLGACVKAECNDGITPPDFVTALLGKYCNSANLRSSIPWKDIGLHTSCIYKKAAGCSAMLGPMNIQVNQRKDTTKRKHATLTKEARPEELNGAETEKRDTDKNMSTMFDILKKNRSVKLECLVLNRNSFAQTVENIFAFSFLVKDGRVRISVVENNVHMVFPRNAPSASDITSKEVSYCHFVFRFDFQDWKLMKDSMRAGEELMPHRSNPSISVVSPKVSVICNSVSKTPAPIEKCFKNRRHVVQNRLII